MATSKVSKNQGFTISLEDTFLEEPQEWKKPTSPPTHPPRPTHTHTHSHTNTHIRTSFPCLLIVKMNPGSIPLQEGFQRYKTFPRSSMHSPSLNLFQNLFEICDLECLNSAFFEIHL